MYLFLRQIVLTGCALFGTAIGVSAHKAVSDSLQKVLADTEDPRQRVQLLLNLKDLNEDNSHNLPYSIQLFREAAAIGDTYAMSVAVIPIVSRYAVYTEKKDSLHYYFTHMRCLTPGTAEEGIDEYAETNVAFNRLLEDFLSGRQPRIAYETLVWCDSLDRTPCNIYQQIKVKTIRGLADQHIANREKGKKHVSAAQIEAWEQGYALLGQIPALHVRHHFSVLLYFLLSDAYSTTLRYDDLTRFTDDYIAQLDEYCASERQSGRRPYLYIDNNYVRPYLRLIMGATKIERKNYAEQHFQTFRRQMLDASGENLMRNKSYLYELGYQWKATEKNYEEGILYCDSLVRLIEQGEGYFQALPRNVIRAYRNRGHMLKLAGRYDEAFDAYEKTLHVQDSILTAERLERSGTIRLGREMNRLKLDKTRIVIRNRATAIVSFSVIGLLLFGTGVYLFRALRRNQQLQSDILRHTLKAQESEHMKSTFINTICRGIGPPMEFIDEAAQRLMTCEERPSERLLLMEQLRNNTRILLSTLDNMLEAANLDSLTERLRLSRTDIDELCRAELLAASRLNGNPKLTYTIDAPDNQCFVLSHAKYFSFVIRALLDNAGKFTPSGEITLRYELLPRKNELRVMVSDTGPGIASEKRGEIFGNLHENAAASRGLSLVLCRVIAEHLSGSILLDESYTSGARFIFTIPVRS